MLKDLIIIHSCKKASLPAQNIFCVIEYLYGLIHNNTVIMDESFKQVQELYNKNISLFEYEYISIYHFVYSAFTHFYKYSLYLYEINTNLFISNTNTLIQEDYNYISKREYTYIPEDRIIPYKGKGIVISSIYIKCIMRFNYNSTKIQNGR
ncbi:hypothetical protein NEIRO02_2580, partial [Nematocida sp. AWRm79]